MDIKNKTIRILLLANILTIVALCVLFLMWKKEHSEKIRMTENWMISENHLQEQKEVTAKEFHDVYKQLDSLAKAQNIYYKNITNVIKYTYHVKDTTISSSELILNTVSDTKYYDIKRPNYEIKGWIDSNADTMFVDHVEIKDNITTFLYKDWHKKYIKFGKGRYLFKFKPFYTAKVYSEFKKDTVAVEENIKIIKN